eukprot:5459305-Lingulodinium_polyedra.AAC.1
MPLDAAPERIRGLPASLGPEVPIDPSCLQSVASLTASFAAAKRGRAPGVDQEPGELLKAFPGPLAEVYHPLVHKVQASGVEPSAWKLTRYVDLYKGAGPATCNANFRSVGLGVLVAKHHHAFL